MIGNIAANIEKINIRERVPSILSPGTAPRGIAKKKRFQTALTAAGHHELAAAIRECRTNRRCGSTYCATCRRELGETSRRRITDYLLQTFKGDEAAIREEVRHVSGLIALTTMNQNCVIAAIEDGRKIFRKLRRGRPWLWIEGAYELELVSLGHWRKMNAENSAVKKEQILALLDSAPNRSELEAADTLVLVHWHVLMANIYKTDPSKPRMRSALDVLKSEYGQHSRQLYVQKLHASKNIEDSMAKISSYAFKDQYRFKYSFEGNDFENGEYIDDKNLGEFISLSRLVAGGRRRSTSIYYGFQEGFRSP
ncbi:hypothetical protein [Kaistia sp. 32K]|uniref:hypothetical protein n=1 Tax=Kaistia sp. 32K TaxID=2795690 RepID=UPI0019155022|nr:hypothetical protein [Kaistia sp. 32K]